MQLIDFFTHTSSILKAAVSYNKHGEGKAYLVQGLPLLLINTEASGPEKDIT